MNRSRSENKQNQLQSNLTVNWKINSRITSLKEGLVKSFELYCKNRPLSVPMELAVKDRLRLFSFTDHMHPKVKLAMVTKLQTIQNRKLEKKQNQVKMVNRKPPRKSIQANPKITIPNIFKKINQNHQKKLVINSHQPEKKEIASHHKDDFRRRVNSDNCTFEKMKSSPADSTHMLLESGWRKLKEYREAKHLILELDRLRLRQQRVHEANFYARNVVHSGSNGYVSSSASKPYVTESSTKMSTYQLGTDTIFMGPHHHPTKLKCTEAALVTQKIYPHDRQTVRKPSLEC